MRAAGSRDGVAEFVPAKGRTPPVPTSAWKSERREERRNESRMPIGIDGVAVASHTVPRGPLGPRTELADSSSRATHVEFMCYFCQHQTRGGGARPLHHV